MTMPFYTSPEQLMRERSELARKGIARGRSVVVLSYDDGVYVYTWKTDKSFKGCRELTVTLMDGTKHTALFTFVK